MISSDFNSIMSKIKVHLEDKYKRRIYDTDIAKELNISKEHFCRCKKNSKIPLESIISFCAKESIVINYILFDQMPQSLEKPTDKIITVKYFKNINTSAGGGALNEDEEYELLGLDNEVVKSLGGVDMIKNIEALNVTGESMEPIIKDNSIIFIDKSQKNPSFNKEDIYVVNTPNGVLVKKATIIPKYKKLQLLSSNTLYLPEVYDLKEVSILGKVIGVSQC